jgi:hypothetical protein
VRITVPKKSIFHLHMYPTYKWWLIYPGLFKRVYWFATLYSTWFERNGAHGGYTAAMTSLLISTTTARKETGLPDLISLPDLSAGGTVLTPDTPRPPFTKIYRVYVPVY